MLDSLVPYPVVRWVCALLLLALYLVRVALLEGWYIITYALAIYLLNLFIAFLSPKFDPSAQEEDEISTAPPPPPLSSLCSPHLPTPPSPVRVDDGPQLPTIATEEFKPFIRRLPEFKFW